MTNAYLYSAHKVYITITACDLFWNLKKFDVYLKHAGDRSKVLKSIKLTSGNI